MEPVILLPEIPNLNMMSVWNGNLVVPNLIRRRKKEWRIKYQLETNQYKFSDT